MYERVQLRLEAEAMGIVLATIDTCSTTAGTPLAGGSDLIIPKGADKATSAGVGFVVPEDARDAEVEC